MNKTPRTTMQDFRRRTVPDTGPERLHLLRTAMEEAGVSAFLVPRADAHQGENVASCDERLSWLTSFTGSAGLAVVTAEQAALFVDGRYTLQVREEIDTTHFTTLRHPQDKPSDFLETALRGGGRVGYDPWLHGAEQIEKLTEALTPRQITLAPVDNLIDKVWSDRPPPPAEPIVPHPKKFAGASSADKRRDIGKSLADSGLSAAILTLPESIAWLLNIRGSDIARTPVPRAFAILHSTGAAALFTDPFRCDADLKNHLGLDITIDAPEAFGPALDALTGKIGVDRTSAPVWVSNRLEASKADLVWHTDPCTLPKARKNETEIAGARAAHLRDGAAMARFLAWLDGEAPKGQLTEIDVAQRLEAIRAETDLLRDISFETISGSGPNGAIVHYRVSEASNRTIKPGELLLVDSGAQYLDGTTDITRTIAVGEPGPDAIKPFTLVLKGLIAMSRLRWPTGLAGRDLDAVARTHLWQAGLDYDHGTGHGIGSYLGVHEGPQGLSRRSTAVIEPGMILSIEPGYYREGAFGIRTENLAVVSAPAVPEGGEREMLSFETLTLAPIDCRLTDLTLLDESERTWLNLYHAHVLTQLQPLVDAATGRWLQAACAPV